MLQFFPPQRNDYRAPVPPCLCLHLGVQPNCVLRAHGVGEPGMLGSCWFLQQPDAAIPLRYVRTSGREKDERERDRQIDRDTETKRDRETETNGERHREAKTQRETEILEQERRLSQAFTFFPKYCYQNPTPIATHVKLEGRHVEHRCRSIETKNADPLPCACPSPHCLPSEKVITYF